MDKNLLKTIAIKAFRNYRTALDFYDFSRWIGDISDEEFLRKRDEIWTMASGALTEEEKNFFNTEEFINSQFTRRTYR